MTSKNTDSKHTSETKSASQAKHATHELQTKRHSTRRRQKLAIGLGRLGGPVISSSEEDQARPVWSGPTQKMDSNIASHQATFQGNESSFI